VLIRLIHLLRTDKYPDLTDDFAFVVMGSEGRGEQTLSTDQDNAIIYDDSVTGEQLARLEAFSHDLIAALISIGVPPCPGGIMARNPEWRRSLSGWRQELTRWLSATTPDNVMTGSMFMDLRPLYGRTDLVDALRTHAFHYMANEQGFLVRMAQNMTNFAPPLGWFGRIKVEKSGPNRGQIDVKKAGIFAITDGVKALAIEAGRLQGSTHDRMEALVEARVLKPEQAADLRAAFDFLVLMRLQGQVAALRSNATPNNYISLEHLNAMEQGELRLAFEGVAKFQSFIQHHFKLQLLRN
jgi:CBS domain-containing protein